VRRIALPPEPNHCSAFRDKGGTLCPSDLIASRVHTDVLYTLRDGVQIIELGRGLYCLAALGEAEYPVLCPPGRAAWQLPRYQAVDTRHSVSLRSEDLQ